MSISQRDMSLVVTVLNTVKWKINRNRTATVLKYFDIFENVVHSLEPDETPSNYRVTRRLTRLPTLYNVLKYCKKWWNNDEINLPKPECNRTATGNIFNLIMRMTVWLETTLFVAVPLSQYWSLSNWHNLWLRCSSCKLKFCPYFIMFCDI